MTITTASEVTKFLVAEYPSKGATWAMKVVYYIQGWRLAWDGLPMFDDQIEAWDLGPVAPSAYATFTDARETRRMGLPVHWHLTSELESTARNVADYYFPFSGRALIDATHREAPWASTYGTRPSFNSRGSNPIIKEGDMRTYFAQIAARAGDVPQRPATTQTSDSWDLDMDDLERFTKASAERWAEALDLLAK